MGGFMMDLKEYFVKTRGLGVLSTADDEGHVNAAVYSRPHFMDDGSIAFIMNDRLSHANLQTNPYASYLFKSAESGFKGVRLYLQKTREEADTELLQELKKRKRDLEAEVKETRYLVFFKIEKLLPLIGDDEETIMTA
jgi:hypothetical protein